MTLMDKSPNFFGLVTTGSGRLIQAASWGWIGRAHCHVNQTVRVQGHMNLSISAISPQHAPHEQTAHPSRSVIVSVPPASSLTRETPYPSSPSPTFPWEMIQ